MAFVHLHCRSEYSIQDSLVRIKPLIAAVKAAGMPAVALTDWHNLFAAVRFYKAALVAGIKPIVGAEVRVVDEQNQEQGQLILLCRNQQGYRHLCQLLSLSYGEPDDHGPVLRIPWLASRHQGLIAILPATASNVALALLQGQTEQAQQHLCHWQQWFDGVYLQIQRTGRVQDEQVLADMVALGEQQQIPLVAGNDVRFLRSDDFWAHEARTCIQAGYTLGDEQRPRLYSDQQYLRSADAMAKVFADLPQAVTNTVQIARQCNLILNLDQVCLPEFPIPDGLTTAEYFCQLSRQKLQQRLTQDYPDQTQRAGRQTEYQARLEHELSVINQMGFPGYFLIVADFIQWARDHDIPVGPGRGSGAGSLVAYVLGITDLDPIRYELLFERFLNPERVSMPDFDIDFCMEGRDRVIEYVARRYGRQRVSQIATHGTMAAKAVVRDVGRVLGHPYGFVDGIARLIPFEIGMTLAKALEQEPDLRERMESDEEVRELIELAQALEGLVRNVGKHAGGVVISPTDLTDFSALYCESGSDQFVTQYDKDDIESVGLVKFDFLGLRTLTIIDYALANANEQRASQSEKPLHTRDFSLEDQATFTLLKKCQTTAVFQLESRGMKELIRRLQPDCFEDIVALVALFRPGPLQSGMVDDFIDRKHGRAEVTYLHPSLEDILKPTYGVILYQEQVMQIAQVLAGYSLGAADLLRRAMGKKKPEEMAKQRQIFMDGALAKGIDRQQARVIFDLMEKFAGYGFNRSHSAAYALLAYQTAWLKAHYPAAFMAAVMSADMDHTDKLVVLVDECRAMKVTLITPNVNQSDYRFRVNEQGHVLYGLGAIKGVGEQVIQQLVGSRQRQGHFNHLADLCCRLPKFNKRTHEALIKSGAYDDLARHRGELMALLPQAVALAEQTTRQQDQGQHDLFGGEQSQVTELTADLPPWSDEQRLQGERATLGFYWSGHPMNAWRAELKHYIGQSLARCVQRVGPPKPGQRRQRGHVVTTAGLVLNLRSLISRRGGRMAFFTLDDRSQRLDVRVFSDVYGHCRDALIDDRIVVVKGELQWDERGQCPAITAETVLSLDEARHQHAKALQLNLSPEQCSSEFLQQLQQAINPYRDGNCPLRFCYQQDNQQVQLRAGEGWRLRPDQKLLKALVNLLGRKQVRVIF